MAYPVGEILYDATITTNVPLAVAAISSIVKNDRAPVTTTEEVDTGGGVMVYQEVDVAASFQIIFTMTNGGTVIWDFATSVARNNAFAAILTNYGYDPT